MKKLVLEITSHAGDGAVTHRMIESFPATLGRGYHNDIILTDPHVSAQHVRIEYDGDGWKIADLGSENGITVNNKVCRDAAVHLKSGDILRIGRTEIRAYDPMHPVPKEIRLQRAHPFLNALSRPLAVWGLFAAALGTVVGWSYLEVWNPEPGPQLGSAGAAVIAFILLWSALWAVAGRLIRHKSRFRAHVALISLVVIITVGGLSYIQAYVDFLTNENWISAAVKYTINLGLLTSLLYGSLALATDMTRRRRLKAAAFFSVGLLAGIYVLTQVAQRNFTQEPQYPSRLKPYLVRLAPAESLEDFMGSNEKLFESFKTAGKDG